MTLLHGNDGTWAALDIAAIVPAFNEEAAIGTVVRDLHSAVPGIRVYVYDNSSTDQTAAVAAAAGAIVRTETRKGKGNVIRRAFADIDADVYLVIDGDDTYDASAAPRLVERLLSGPLDRVLGVRRPVTSVDSAYRPGHEVGNRLFNILVSRLFGEPVTDMMSGYQVLSRRFVKSFPALSREFEIETELTVHAHSLRVPQEEVEVGFRDRPAGSESKLRTYRDGFRILQLVGRLLAHERPAALFGTIAAMLAALAVVLGAPLAVEYARTGLVPRFPTAILAAAIATIAVLSALVGVILSGILQSRREIARLAYLRLDPLPTPPTGDEPMAISRERPSSRSRERHHSADPTSH